MPCAVGRQQDIVIECGIHPFLSSLEKKFVGGHDMQEVPSDIGKVVLGVGDQRGFFEAETFHGTDGAGEFVFFVVGCE